MSEINYAKKAMKDLHEGEFKRMSVLAGPLPPKRNLNAAQSRRKESLPGPNDMPPSPGLHAGFS